MYRKSSVYVLSLYRALLREASYLPDETARKFFHNYVVKEFRAHRAPKYLRGLHTGDSRQIRALGTTRVTKHIAEARKGLKLLVDANHGSPTHLRKIFDMSYGRRGKRRYELMKDLMPKNPVPVDESAVQELANALELNRASPATKEPRLTEKMLTLIKSQKGQKDRLFSKPNIKSTKPMIPETNSWGGLYLEAERKMSLRSGTGRHWRDLCYHYQNKNGNGWGTLPWVKSLGKVSQSAEFGP